MSDWRPIETCPETDTVWLGSQDEGPWLGYKIGGGHWGRVGGLPPSDPPTHWIPLEIPELPPSPPPAQWARRSPSEGYFPLPHEPQIHTEKQCDGSPLGEVALNWHRLSTCPVDEEVWLIDNDNKGRYVGKILKPTAERASRTKVPLFYALEDRTDHPNPVMWAKKNNDSKPSAEPSDTPPAERSTQDYQSNLHAIHERLNTINAVLRKRFDDIDKRLVKLCEWLDLANDGRRVVDAYVRESLELLSRQLYNEKSEKGPVSETS